MKIFVDENIPLITVTTLREMGHDVLDIRGSQNEGISNGTLWKLTLKEKRLLITTDKGFNQYRNIYHHGILIVCLRQPNRYKIHEKIISTLKKFNLDDWNNLLVVVRDNFQSIYRINNYR